MEFEVGDWIEFDNKIFEITKVTAIDVFCLEVMYNVPTLKLKYGELTIIGRALLNGSNL